MGGCIKGGVVEYETGEKVCSKEGVGAVHGMTVAHTDKEDPSQFDIFLVMTGGAQFVGGESSVRKVRVQKDLATNDVKVLSHQRFGDDLFVASVNRTSPDHKEANWGGVEYIGDNSDTCTKVFPNKVDSKGSFFLAPG